MGQRGTGHGWFGTAEGRWRPAVVAALMIAPLALLVSASSRPSQAPPVPGTHSVQGLKVLHPHHVAVADQAKRAFDPGRTRWPAATSASASLAVGRRVHVDGLPIWAEAADGQLSGLRVQMLDRSAAARAGVSGVLFAVTPTGGQGKATVGVDYSGFGNAYGGDFGRRLRLVQLPDCALTTPRKAECRTRTPLPGATNRPADRTASATVDVRSRVVLAAASGADGSTGSFAATSLKSAGSWSAGGSNGSFDYSYPITVPGAPSPMVPDLDLAYDSGSVDGQTVSTNAQSSWVGDGWSMADSFVEQSFAPCADSPEGSPSPVSSGDSCYGGQVLTMSLDGSNSTLVWDAAKQVYAVADDPGQVVSHVTGSDNGSGTHDTDYWVVTGRDGTRYYFGRNQLPGWTANAPVTNSVDTGPVYSAHPGDPCYKASGFADSVCTMAYRWHLDYAVDAHGNAMSYYYAQDTNNYGADNGTTKRPYVRDSHLARIDYGFRDGGAYGTVPDQVVFNTAPRCVATTCDPISATNAATQYPDVPYDLMCASTATCTAQSPAFFSTTRLTGITTRQYSTTASKYVPVDTYTLTQTEPATGDGTSPTLWLSSVARTGNDRNAGATADAQVPAVTFAGLDLANRVDAATYPPLYRYRISAVTSELGSVTSVTYGLPNPCTAALVKTLNPATNTNSCYPVDWTPKDYVDPIHDWFNKWAATAVDVSDPTGHALAEHTEYHYNGGAAWHYDDEELTKPKYQTWGQFRGYASVETRTGDGVNDRQTSSVTSYYRGMDGDWLSPTSTRSVSVTDSQGGVHADLDELAGKALETTAYRGAGGPVETSRITSYWVSAPVATRTRTGLPTLTARMVDTAEVWQRLAVTDGGTTSWRYTETDNTYDPTVTDPLFGLLTTSYTHTVPANPAYDQCTTVTYAKPNPSNNLVGLIAGSEKDSVACGGFTEGSPASVPAAANTLTPPASVDRPDQVVTAVRNFYDDPAFDTTFPQANPPSVGDATMTRAASGYTAGAFTWQTTGRAAFDALGRQVTAYDGNGNRTTSAYTANAIGLTTGVTVTNPLGQTVSSTLEPQRGLELTLTDPNKVVTTVHYDGLGRTTDVWKYSRATADPANAHYTYTVSNSGLSGVRTDTLNNELTYVPEITLEDAEGRVRQTQTPTPQGGRLISESFYDSRGWEWKQNTGYWDKASPPSLSLASVADNQVDSQQRQTFDGLGRVVATDSEQDGVVKEHAVTVYNGDTTTVIPPTGGVIKSTHTDPLGRTSSLTEYLNAPTLHTPADPFTGIWSVTGGTPVTTSYGFDGHGNPNRTTDASGANWTSTYNLLGQVVSKSDPDAGTSTLAYDGNGNTLQTTDSRGTISYTYDTSNRKTGEYAAPVAGQSAANQIASWVYDNANNAVTGMPRPIGQLTTSTSYDNGSAYTTQALGFNVFGESLGQTVTIPAAAGMLAGSYTFKHLYTDNAGLLKNDIYPDGGGLPAETVTHTYATVLDLPAGLSTNSAGYAQNTTYTALGQVGQEQVGDTTNQAWITNKFDDHTGSLLDQTVKHAVGTAAPSPTEERSYSYDLAGNPTSQTETRLGNGSASETQCFRYDGLDRLSAAWTGTDNCAATPTDGDHSTVGDNLGAASAYWTTWAFDSLGNRTTQTQHATATGGSDTTTTYRYDTNNANQPHTLTATSLSGGTTGSTSYSYDAAGDMISRVTAEHGNQTLTWDAAGRLSRITSGADTTSFVYDADGDILLQRDPASTVLYLPGEQITLNTTTNTCTGTRYYSLPGGGVAVRTGSGSSYDFELGDPHNTATLALDSTAQTPTWRQFDVYGNPRGPAVSWFDNRGFLNQPTDADTGLDLLGARQYDPTTGRFLSVDPVLDNGDPQQLNGYGYADDNPVSGSDPTGLRPCLDDLPCGAGLGEEWHQQQSVNAREDNAYYAAHGRGHGHPSATHKKTCHWYNAVCQAKHAAHWVNKHKAVIIATVVTVAFEGLCNAAFDAESGGSAAVACAAAAGAVFNYAYDASDGKHHSALDIVKDTATGAVTGAVAHGAATAVTKVTARVASKGVTAAVKALTRENNAPTKSVTKLAGECLTNSFTAGTLVVMANGHTKAIQDVKVGDKVAATDPATGKTAAEPVTALHDNHDTQLTDVTVTDEHGHTSVVHTTWHHPFYDASTGTWTDAADLTFGTNLYTTDGHHLTVLAVHSWTGQHEMHNLTIQDLHTYYVLAGTTPLLVHNCGTFPDDRAGMDFTDNGRQRVYDDNSEKNGGVLKCTYCGRTVVRRASRDADGNPIKGLPDDAQVDHGIPKAQGGCGAPHNGCVACRPCNRDKSAKTLEQWDNELREFLDPEN